MSASIEFENDGNGTHVQLMIDDQPAPHDMDMERLKDHQKIATVIFAQICARAEQAGAVLEQSHAHRH
jgi:hypothetical protein